MKILLLGDNHKRCENYEAALQMMNVDYDLSLDGDFSLYTHLIIPGGIDVDPDLYNEEKDPSVKMIDRDFDDIQLKAIDYFVKNRKPILGICRGHQLLNVYFGGTLIQDIKNHTLPEYEDVYHEIKNSSGFMKELYGNRCKVNSTHHQSVNKLGEGLKVVSRADDDTIEALEHEDLPIISVQFHPERMAIGKVKEKTADGFVIFNYFLRNIK